MKTNETDGATEIKHPPTPWMVKDNGDIVTVWDTVWGKPNLIAVPARQDGLVYKHGNAALIVQAVNSYEALLAVAKAAREWIKLEDESSADTLNKYGIDFKPIPKMEELRAALDKLTKDSVDKKQSTE